MMVLAILYDTGSDERLCMSKAQRSVRNISSVWYDVHVKHC